MTDLRTVRATVAPAVQLAVRYWPNSHLGDLTPREDLHSAFLFLRARLRSGMHIQAAAGQLEGDAYRHMNM